MLFAILLTTIENTKKPSLNEGFLFQTISHKLSALIIIQRVVLRYRLESAGHNERWLPAGSVHTGIGPNTPVLPAPRQSGDMVD